MPIYSELSGPNADLRQYSSPLTFLRLPLEIRRKIYYLTLLLQWKTHRGILHVNEIAIYQWYEWSGLSDPPKAEEKRYYQGLHRIYWGTRQSTNLYPVNKQWYAEIQEVLYSKFVFKLHALLRGGKLKDISCSILPPKAFEYIRSMRFVFNVPWKYIDRGFGEDLIEQTQALLGRFSVLKSVAILFKHPEEETPTSSGVMTNGRCFYISPEKEPEVLETMLSLSRLFKDMNDISILVADSPEDLEWYANTRVPDEWEEEGLECENLAVSCAHIVHEEFKSERASSGCSIPRIYVGVEEHCPIWGVERWDGLGYVGYARWTTDFRISCLE